MGILYLACAVSYRTSVFHGPDPWGGEVGLRDSRETAGLAPDVFPVPVAAMIGQAMLPRHCRAMRDLRDCRTGTALC
jgi:hypothetical protein